MTFHLLNKAFKPRAFDNFLPKYSFLELATSTAAVHQKVNSRDTAVLLRMLSLVPYDPPVPYPNNHRLFIRQTTYSCPKIFVYSRAAPVHFCAKPNSNPNPNLSPSSTQAVPLPGEIAIDLTEMQVAAHAKTRCRIVRL